MSSGHSASTPCTGTEPVIPRHVAIIMDGNNRWAKRNRVPGPAGHRAGVEAVRDVLRACQKRGVEVLTLFAFSSENWGRPQPEVRALLALLSRYLRNEVRELHEDGIRLRFIGQRHKFSPRLQRLMRQSEELTAGNTGATLVIAVDYGGQWDIVQATQKLAERVKAGTLQPDEISAEMIDANISISELPRPDLCIRTGGDARISNFMLWHFAYSALYFTDILWPDFGEKDFDRALADYSKRERRFGLREGEPEAGDAVPAHGAANA